MNSEPELKSLNNQQLEILKLFSRELDEAGLIETKRLIVKYLSGKITNLADDVWDKENWADDEMEKLLRAHNRTPYNPKN